MTADVLVLVVSHDELLSFDIQLTLTTEAFNVLSLSGF